MPYRLDGFAKTGLRMGGARGDPVPGPIGFGSPSLPMKYYLFYSVHNCFENR